MASSSAAPQNINEGEQAIAIGDWSTGLFNCFDDLVPNCLMSYCCPCVTYGQISKRIGSTENCQQSCLIFACLLFFGCGGCGVCFLRSDVREKFEIKGSQVEDCLCGCCCGCCSLAQMATHTKSYKPGVLSIDEPPTYTGVMRRA